MCSSDLNFIVSDAYARPPAVAAVGEDGAQSVGPSRRNDLAKNRIDNRWRSGDALGSRSTVNSRTASSTFLGNSADRTLTRSLDGISALKRWYVSLLGKVTALDIRTPGRGRLLLRFPITISGKCEFESSR